MRVFWRAGTHVFSSREEGGQLHINPHISIDFGGEEQAHTRRTVDRRRQRGQENHGIRTE